MYYPAYINGIGHCLLFIFVWFGIVHIIKFKRRLLKILAPQVSDPAFDHGLLRTHTIRKQNCIYSKIDLGFTEKMGVKQGSSKVKEKLKICLFKKYALSLGLRHRIIIVSRELLPFLRILHSTLITNCVLAVRKTFIYLHIFLIHT